MRGFLRWVLGFSKQALKAEVFAILDELAEQVKHGVDVDFVVSRAKRRIEDWLD